MLRALVRLGDARGDVEYEDRDAGLVTPGMAPGLPEGYALERDRCCGADGQPYDVLLDGEPVTWGEDRDAAIAAAVEHAGRA